MVNIVIIDSGVNLNHKLLKDSDIESFELVKGKIVKGGIDNYGHGTAVSGIIYRNTTDVKITMVKLKGVENGVEELDLIAVLNYILQCENINIVNLSLGVNICEQYNKLYNICQDLSEKGVIIISAFDNTGAISYPAAFDNVIGVTTGQFCNRVNDFEYVEDKIVNIAAKGNIQRVAWSNPEYLMIGGNSFACAHVTAQTAKFIAGGAKTKNEILEKFKEISIRRYNTKEAQTPKSLLGTIKKAALFPFNKEMHGLIRYANLLSFDITNVYDSKYSSTVGATTSYLLKDNTVKNFLVKNIDNIEWNTFDTLILGHTDELSSLINKDNFKKDIIEEAVKREKQVYSFDDLSKLGYDDNPNIYYPQINATHLPPNRFGMLYRISKPVMGVFGTSSRQGKFTLQLKLREILLKQGYSVGQIGTEPSALLYGMDYCFPMGYNSSVYIKEFDTIRYLNYIINDLCIKEKDIILVGSQSGTVPYDTGNIVQYTVPQYNFLMGTQPDCVVLCVNPFDGIEYIRRTINFIESSADCKVISIVIFPMDIKDDWTGIYGSKKLIDKEKYIKIKQGLFDYFNVPIFKLGDERDMNLLSDVVTDFFAE